MAPALYWLISNTELIFQILMLSRLIRVKWSNYFRRIGVAEYAEQKLQ